MTAARPTSATARLARYGFTDPGRAAQLVGADGLNLWNHDTQQPLDDGAAVVFTALAGAADPDLALRQLHRLVEAAEHAGDTGVLAEIEADERYRLRLTRLLGASVALGDHLVACPADRQVLADPLAAQDLFGPDELSPGEPTAGGGTGPDAVAALRRAYRRRLLAVAGADLADGWDIEAVAAELARLADATLAAALAIATAELPAGAAPARLAVIAMGKCGGRELNYVSDVDVLFVAAPGARTDDAEVPADGALATATTLARRLMDVCRQVAWPVDAALRPEGRDGPLVRTVPSYLAYYRKWARTWEFQALLKARPAAGDAGLAADWFAEVGPLVWHAAERPEAVEDVRAMRRRTTELLSARDAEREIKLAPGGLRDVEFAVQLLQLVHGRADESLRGGNTLAALRALTAGGYVGRADGQALDRAYRYLRSVEHRLQLQRLRRTHRIPDDPAALRWLAQILGYRPDNRRDAAEAFLAEWTRCAREVRRLHTKLLYRPLLEAVAKVPTDDLRLTPQAARRRLEVLGFADPAGALRHLEALTGGVSRAAAIQHTLLPVMLSEFADAAEPDRGLLAYRQVSGRLGRTPWYLRLLRDEGPVALRLARLLGTSRYVSDLLVRDPEALRLLASDEELAPRPRQVLVDSMAATAGRYDDPAEAIRAIRALRRRELFRIACADLLGLADCDTVGQALTDVTDAVLGAALASACAAVGRDGPLPVRLAIIGMGRLGGAELAYSSDADVLFVYEPLRSPSDGPVPARARRTGDRATAGDEPTGDGETAGGTDAEAQAAARVAEGVRRLLAEPAPDPPLVIDPALRPEGRQGPLARSLSAYRTYYARWSRVWEAQALLRARFVAGDADLGARFGALADPIRYPLGGLTPPQVTEIRRVKARVDSERLPRGADPATHTKLGRGGLADVEWTVQLLQLRYGHATPALRTPRTLDALDAARAAGLLDPADAAALANAWLLTTRVRNAIMLVRGRPSDQLPRRGPELAGVVRALGYGGRRGDPGEFLDEYLRTARRARQVVERVFDA